MSDGERIALMNIRLLLMLLVYLAPLRRLCNTGGFEANPCRRSD